MATASRLDLPFLAPLYVAVCGRLQLGTAHWATSVALLQVVYNWPNKQHITFWTQSIWSLSMSLCKFYCVKRTLAYNAFDSATELWWAIGDLFTLEFWSVYHCRIVRTEGNGSWYRSCCIYCIYVTVPSGTFCFLELNESVWTANLGRIFALSYCRKYFPYRTYDYNLKFYSFW